MHRFKILNELNIVLALSKTCLLQAMTLVGSRISLNDSLVNH